MDEIIFVDKPAGMTSFGVVARVRRILSEQEGKSRPYWHTGSVCDWLINFDGRQSNKEGHGVYKAR